MYLVYDNANTIKEYKNTEDEAYGVIKQYLDDTGFTSYYYRQSFADDGSIWIDYGSHTHFFYIKEVEDGKI